MVGLGQFLLTDVNQFVQLVAYSIFAGMLYMKDPKQLEKLYFPWGGGPPV